MSTARVRLSDKAEQELLRRIRSGEMPAGTRLPSEPELAEMLHVSRGILREALNSLQTKGYVSRTPHGGSFVEQTCGENIGRSVAAQVRGAQERDLIEFREAMESRAVQLIAERATDEEIASLRAMLDVPREQMGGIDYYFHYRMAELTRNRLFAVFIDLYYDAIRRFAEGSYQDEKRFRQMTREHLRIVEALEKRDKRAAAAAVRSHLRQALRRAEEGAGGVEDEIPQRAQPAKRTEKKPAESEA